MKRLKALLSCAAVSLAMYTRLPMPHLHWTIERMKYALGFFPLAGVLCGGAQALFLLLVRTTGVFGPSFRAAVLLALPIAVSGGIHLDGFCDVCDAAASHKNRQEQLEILKDSHCGAFAIIGCGAFFILSFAAWRDVDVFSPAAMALCFVPVLSRSLSGLAACSFRNARGGGQLAAFTRTADKRAIRAMLAGWLCLAAAGIAAFGGPLFAMLLGACAAFALFSLWAVKTYGGFTGDLCGCLLEIVELVCVAAFTL